MAEVMESEENASENKKKTKAEEKNMCSLDIPVFNTKRRVIKSRNKSRSLIYATQ